MNKKGIISIVLILVIIAVAAIYFIANPGETSSNTDKNKPASSQVVDEGYVFVANGKEIRINDEFSREKFGQELEYSEISSCAFEGLDKTYKYENYEITTYPNEGKENILSIYLLDDTVATKEGVKIADSYTQMVEKYSDNYQQEDNLYIYKKGNMSLKFIVENDVITSIEYSLNVEVK